MNITKPFIERPVATILLTITLCLIGILGYLALPIADLPNVDLPVIMIRAQQAGGTPEEIASSVTEPLERRLGQIPGTNEMTSESTRNQTRITLQFNLSKDINDAARDVEAALQAAHADLPTSMRSNPAYFKTNPAISPIMILAVTSNTKTMPELYDYATTVLQHQLASVKGVGQVELGGGALPSVRIELNPHSLYKYGIGFEDVRAALASTNAHTPKGFIDEGDKRYQLATNDQAVQADAYRDLIIAYRNDAPVMLKNVSTIHDGVENIYNAGYFNNQPSVVLVIFPQAGSNVIKTTDEIHRKLKLIRAALPADIKVNLAIDRSFTIRATLSDTQMTLITSIFLVIIVVLVFLRNIRSIIIPSIVLPTSTIATFAIMHLLGFSLDAFSLMALTISTGFVVDDAIVVLENINRHLEDGIAPKDAALYGAKEISFTVISITISLIAVFIPILLMQGVMGKLFHEFAMTLSITLIISMILSLTLTPMMCAYLLVYNPKREDEKPNKIAKFFEIFFNYIDKIYQDTLYYIMQFPLTVALTIPFTIILMIFLFITMPKGLIPNEDIGILFGSIQGDQSISFKNMQQKLEDVQKQILDDPDINTISSFTGGRAINQSNLFISLKDKKKRKSSIIEIQNRLSDKFKNMVGAKFYVRQPTVLHSGGRSSNATYQYTLQSDSSEKLYEWMPKLVEALKHHPNILTDISSDVEQGGNALNIDILRDVAARVKLTPQLISNTLYDSFGQRAASIIYNPLNQYRVIMETDPKYASNTNSLDQVWISVAGGTPGGGTVSNTIRVKPNSPLTQEDEINQENFRNQVANKLAGGSGASNGSAVSTNKETMIPLSFVTNTRKALTPLAINHQGLFVSATLSFNLAKNKSLSDAVQLIRDETLKIHLPKNIAGSFTGNAAQFEGSVQNNILLILSALAAVYITLGVLYESYIHPLTIISTLPSAGVGALLALDLFGEEFSVVTMIGIILLIGIVKKNAILLIDFAIKAEETDNMDTKSAILLACKLRFRPILMTTIAAAFGAFPLILSNGYGCEIRQPLGIAIVGGLIVSQALTLYTTPIIYIYMDQLRHNNILKRIFAHKGQQRA